MRNQQPPDLPFTPPGFGWVRDLPDPRDYVVTSPSRISRFFRPNGDSAYAEHPQHDRCDFSGYFPPVRCQTTDINSSSAFACTALFEYFHFRYRGFHKEFSKQFVHENAQKLLGKRNELGIPIRDALRTIRQFGTPEFQYCESGKLSLSDPFLYGFHEFFAHFEYFRLDKGIPSLSLIKAFLISEIPIAMGVCVPSGIGSDGLFPYFPASNSIIGGQVLVAVGFDDNIHFNRQIPKGAIRVRNSWGANWGEDGYGWIPYGYIASDMVGDCWIVLDEDWMFGGEDPINPKIGLVNEIEKLIGVQKW